jgi:RNA polymerase sigma factor (TIGR02999 family)
MGLSTSQMARMNSLLNQALALDPSERQRWLEALSAEDRDLASAEAVATLADKAAGDAFFDRNGCGASKGLNQTYIRFVQLPELRAEDPRRVFAIVSQARRNALVDTARARLAQRRDGGTSEPTGSTKPLENVVSPEEGILYVHEALLVLEEAVPELARLVEMRYYGGYSEAEIAETLGVTERTVHRDWVKALVLLQKALKTGSEQPGTAH